MGQLATYLRGLSIGLVSTLALGAAGSAEAAFTVNQATGAHYVPVSPIQACGAGFCRTFLKPATVLDLGKMNAVNTKVLADDLTAQKSGGPGYGVTAYGDPLAINFNITDYQAINDGSTGGGVLVVDYTPQRGFVAPGGLHWVQIVQDNWNITGVNGANLSAPTGRGKPENVVDAPGVTSPFYDDASAAAASPFNTNPPHFEDYSRRPEPNAANPLNTWNALLYLVSDDGEGNLTVYDGVEWGWETRYAPLRAGVPEPATWLMMIVGIGGIGAMTRRRPLAKGA
jgi:hypothetical protein